MTAPIPSESANPNRLAVRPLTVILRFISCGLLCLAAGTAWWLMGGTQKVGVFNSLGDLMILLGGFMAGGLFWFIRDLRRQMRQPQHAAGQTMVFSFVVFVVMPLAALLLVGLIWVIALLI